VVNKAMDKALGKQHWYKVSFIDGQGKYRSRWVRAKKPQFAEMKVLLTGGKGKKEYSMGHTFVSSPMTSKEKLERQKNDYAFNHGSDKAKEKFKLRR
jgi:hypothetical protein